VPAKGRNAVLIGASWDINRHHSLASSTPVVHLWPKPTTTTAFLFQYNHELCVTWLLIFLSSLNSSIIWCPAKGWWSSVARTGRQQIII